MLAKSLFEVFGRVQLAIALHMNDEAAVDDSCIHCGSASQTPWTTESSRVGMPKHHQRREGQGSFYGCVHINEVSTFDDIEV